MRIFNNNATAAGVVIATLAAAMVKYSETNGKLTYSDWAQISGIVGAGLLSIYPSSSPQVKVFDEINRNIEVLQNTRGIFGINQHMLDLLKRLNQEDKPCYIVCNETNTYLWMNELGAKQNSQGNPEWDFNLDIYRDSSRWFNKATDLSELHYRVKHEGNFMHRYVAINQGTQQCADYESFFEKFELNCDPADNLKKQYVRYVTNHRFALIQ